VKKEKLPEKEEEEEENKKLVNLGVIVLFSLGNQERLCSPPPTLCVCVCVCVCVAYIASDPELSSMIIQFRLFSIDDLFRHESFH
jgi:hypothetical protein